METTPSPRTKSQLPPDHIGLLIAAVIMMVGGWWGLYVLLTQTIPRVGQRWIFFMLVQVAVTGTAIPVVRFFNVRFTPVDKDIPPSGVILRQATWVGLLVVTCLWLQIPRVLTWSNAAFLLIIFIVLESFLRMREREDAP